MTHIFCTSALNTSVHLLESSCFSGPSLVQHAVDPVYDLGVTGERKVFNKIKNLIKIKKNCRSIYVAKIYFWLIELLLPCQE